MDVDSTPDGARTFRLARAQHANCQGRAAHVALLDQIHSPADVRALPEAALPELCAAVRDRVIDVVSAHKGAHFGSNLGTVELAVALHRVFDTPRDQLVWDVGHQAYPHKILTGRSE